MKSVLHIAPIALLFAGAVVAVWRGMEPRSDRNRPNRKKGKGSK